MASTKTSKPDSSATNVLNPRAFDKLYWLRAGFAVIAGFTVAEYIATDYTTGILIGLIFYILTFYLGRYFWYKDVGPQNVSKIYTTGIGGFVFLFLFTWILIFTVTSA